MQKPTLATERQRQSREVARWFRIGLIRCPALSVAGASVALPGSVSTSRSSNRTCGFAAWARDRFCGRRSGIAPAHDVARPFSPPFSPVLAIGAESPHYEKCQTPGHGQDARATESPPAGSSTGVLARAQRGSATPHRASCRTPFQEFSAGLSRWRNGLQRSMMLVLAAQNSVTGSPGLPGALVASSLPASSPSALTIAFRSSSTWTG